VTSGSPSPVRLRGVSKRYGSTVAVSGLDLDVGRAEVLALLGPNGAGKTTTVEMCEGFVRPDEGTIEILGMDPAGKVTVVRAEVPQIEMQSYALDLKSRTQGRATFQMEFAKYSQVPGNLQDKIIAQAQTEE